MALTWDEFRKVDMRVGKVIEVQDFPEARNPSYKLTIDFGPLGMKKSSAAIRPWYRKEDLLGRQVVAVFNFRQSRLRTLYPRSSSSGPFRRIARSSSSARTRRGNSAPASRETMAVRIAPLRGSDY